MSDFGTKLKDLLGRGAKFIGRTANSTAKATKYKVNEISALNQRRELMSELGKKVYALCEQGLTLPAEANDIVAQIKKLDEELDALRANHTAEKAAAAEQHALEKAARASERAAAKAAEAIEKSTAAVQVDAPDINDVPVQTPADEAPVAPTLELDIEKAAEPEKQTDVPTLEA